MRIPELQEFYTQYLACLNAQDWGQLGAYVHSEVSHNGRFFGLGGYRAMLENDFIEIPDLVFRPSLLACQPPHIAARLQFDCRPKALFLGLHVNGKRLKFAENVFYEISERKIWKVWSVTDKSEIEERL